MTPEYSNNHIEQVRAKAKESQIVDPFDNMKVDNKATEFYRSGFEAGAKLIMELIDGHGPQANRLSDAQIKKERDRRLSISLQKMPHEFSGLSNQCSVEGSISKGAYEKGKADGFKAGFTSGAKWVRDNHTGPQTAGQWIPVSEGQTLPTGIA